MANQTLAEQGLTRAERQALANKRTAVTVFQVSWIMVFVCLVVVNLQVRSNYPTWPPEGVTALDRVLPTLATVGLLVSAFLASRGLTALRADRRGTFMSNWRGAILLGVGFIAIMAFEWVTVEFSGQYSNVFRVMTAYHAIHALVIGYLMVNALNKARAGAYTAVDNWDVEGAAKLWYFVVVAWILFYVVLYVI
ncbi:MAG: cytochrome c oxidase subunit 3 [Anaerolinea sp.]|nr:cytochrome c oxidase subunit 3 [Anaerolinea sp.]